MTTASELTDREIIRWLEETSRDIKALTAQVAHTNERVQDIELFRAKAQGFALAGTILLGLPSTALTVVGLWRVIG